MGQIINVKNQFANQGVVNTSRTLGKREIKPVNFYIPKSQNYDAAKITCFTVTFQQARCSSCHPSPYRHWL